MCWPKWSHNPIKVGGKCAASSPSFDHLVVAGSEYRYQFLGDRPLPTSVATQPVGEHPLAPPIDRLVNRESTHGLTRRDPREYGSLARTSRLRLSFRLFVRPGRAKGVLRWRK